jgi:hypothetical protein
MPQQVTVSCECPDQPPGQGMQAIDWQAVLNRVMPLVIQLLVAAFGNPPVGGPGQAPQGGAPQSRR